MCSSEKCIKMSSEMTGTNTTKKLHLENLPSYLYEVYSVSKQAA